MRFLSLLLLAPWLLVLGWAYWSYPKSLLRPPSRRWFDALVLLLAAAAAAWLARFGYDGYVAAPVDALGRPSGGIWQHVAPALYAYAGFVALLLAALGLRHWLWRRNTLVQRNSHH